MPGTASPSEPAGGAMSRSVATVAAPRLTADWGIGYAVLIPYATPGFVGFGLCAMPASCLASSSSRNAPGSMRCSLAVMTCS